ncbi:MAG TPA: nuclear transport factor 2 family protein [Caldimonas sp.]|nr:nuclear transport factor 2 family protein [Caldimonas sp.]
MRASDVISVLLCALLITGCTPRFDAATASRDLLKRDAEWAELASAGKDVERVVSYWADDARIIEPGQPVIAGKAAIRAYVAASFQTPGFHIHWVSEAPVFSADGTLAYMPGTDEMAVPGPNGQPLTIHTRGISIWRRDPDGAWRCVIDIANEAPPAPEAAEARATP